MNINNIKNETLAKLTAKEIGELGLLDCGVMTYKGQLKTKRNGFTVENGDGVRSFTNSKTDMRYDFVKIQSVDDVDHYAMRVYDIFCETYCDFLQPLAGIDFLK